jgi:hypothetical protein
MRIVMAKEYSPDLREVGLGLGVRLDIPGELDTAREEA